MLEISQAATEAVQALRYAGLAGFFSWNSSDYRRAEEIIQLAIERETAPLREKLALAEEDAWKYRLLNK